MDRPIFAQLFSKPGQGAGNNEEKRRRLERAADRAGQGGLGNKLGLFKTDEWSVERQHRQQSVRDKYFKDKQRMHVQERRAEEQLKRQTESRKREIENYYRVGELGQTDPRLETAKQKAKRKYGRYEQKEQRRHHRQWLQSFRKMRRQRDKGYRQITKSMKKEHRRSRGLPDELQAPWKI
ncbi:MAG: hypothetical protein A3E37_02240 [Candidatus Andersenbacteria bacterium RIFCSPHIGHO2_12_FULL_46_9]|nr:MAG: hypothetical protein UW94_C0011G0026 [Parcubacteria group bacterium GW2011_GWA2_45_14]OGY34568.1 MAG: hypothetical protein A3B76_06275 [Candidatus Andersenbacteria bacterium RIFCSPHIGHO2_02_FULL_46_16]OGY36360.1 MAG: hypothetical protein A3E37_02240 [Candidatus Andersenbacteria bacterium RIFCSPHIGHO2_12_FULL_46_9]OGY37853.1 MAG: hypothetical protein A3I08_01530 [Candidatus Andersenbacteria bacterium RIFCSPLOWO2_02_FULL_46_11]HBE89699.1 hypothetical protein [Candidatus Andersenbacteria b